MKKILALFLALVATPAAAQWQVPSGAIPVGRGAGFTGFNTVTGSAGTGAKCLLDTSPPTFGTCPASNLLSSNNVWTGTNAFNNAAGITVDTARFWAQGTCNLFVGQSAGSANIFTTCGAHSGDLNTMVGASAGPVNTTGFALTFVGNASGASNTTGDSSTCVGTQSCVAGTDASANTGVGVDTLFSNIHGANSTAIGHHTMVNSVFPLGNGEATAIGAEAAKNGVGAIGMTVGGYRSGFNLNASAIGSAFWGMLSGFSNTSGAQNSYFGQESGFSGTSATGNAYHGYRSGYSNITGGGNAFFGPFAGFYETGSSKLFIDNQSRASEADARLKALIYGTFGAAPANQSLTINGVLAALGTQTNDSAAAGYIGEYSESVVTSGSAVSLVSGTPKDVTTLTLATGDWDITASVNVLGSGTTSFSSALGSISPTLNTLDTTPLAFGIVTYGASPIVPPAATAGVLNMNVGPVRKSIASSTTYHLVAQAGFTVSTATAWGTIRARRIR